MESNLKLLKNLSNAATLLNATNDQKLSLQDAKVVVLNLNETYNNHTNNSFPLTVTKLQPQQASRQLVAKMYNLNSEQERAFMIITEHLDDEGKLIKRIFLINF